MVNDQPTACLLCQSFLGVFWGAYNMRMAIVHSSMVVGALQRFDDMVKRFEG